MQHNNNKWIRNSMQQAMHKKYLPPKKAAQHEQHMRIYNKFPREYTRCPNL